MKSNIFICGPSGTGKSSSLRNLDPETTAILNIEQKALPFKKAGKFKMNINCKTYADFFKGFQKALSSEKVEVVVIESFTALTEAIYREGSKMHDGFDLWDFYSKEIDKILHMSKSENKFVVFLGIDEFIDDSEKGVAERYIKVQGRVWRKSIEKEFVIVLYTDTMLTEEDELRYIFVTNKVPGRRNISAKSPAEMLPPIMENDLNEVLVLINQFYQDEE